MGMIRLRANFNSDDCVPWYVTFDANVEVAMCFNNDMIGIGISILIWSHMSTSWTAINCKDTCAVVGGTWAVKASYHPPLNDDWDQLKETIVVPC